MFQDHVGNSQAEIGIYFHRPIIHRQGNCNTHKMAANLVPQRQVNESLVEFLTTEMVEAMVRTVKDDTLRLGSGRNPSTGNPTDGAGGPKDYSEGDEAMEAVYYKLEMIGFRVGERLIER